MKYFRPLYPFLLGLAVILNSSILADPALVNSLAQLLLFTVVVCIPIWRTGRMSYVDIGWPWGLVVLGVVSLVLSPGYWVRSLTVSVVVILIGLRMGLGILKMWREGRLKKEFPRYQYQRIVWQKEGKTTTALALQVDAISQGLANASFFAFPVFIIAANTREQLHLLELIGLTVWAMAFVMESIADLQKMRFLKEMKKAGMHRQVCNIGLWKFSRHPNYFAQWMVWNGLVIAAVPSWLALKGVEPDVLWWLLGLGLLMASIFMYRTLVYITGAVPSEYYSVRKRSGYAEYQKQTNRFFPGPKKC